MKNSTKIFILIVLAAAAFFYFKGPAPAEIKNTANAGNAIICFGDSLTYGYGAEQSESYPTLLGKRTARPVINMGVNGETAVGAARRIEQALEGRPYMVIIEFGGNDFMKQIKFENTLAAIDAMVLAVQNAGAIAVIADTGGNSAMRRYTKEYRKIARARGAVFIPEIMDGIFGNRSLKSDQIHPNARGYAEMESKIYNAIKGYL